MKKNLLFLVVPLLLSGCSNGPDNVTPTGTSTEDCLITNDTTINFLCMADSDYHDSLQAMIDSFVEIEPHVKVNLYNPLGSGNYSAIERIVVSGFFKEDYPDLVQCYPDNVVKYIARGYALNVDDYLNNPVYGLGNDRDDYVASFLEEGSKYPVSGTYSLPFCKSTELLYYNADVLLGLDLSAVDVSINNGNPLTAAYLDDLTWEELFDKLCPALFTYNAGLDDKHKIFVDSADTGLFTYDSDENFFITLAHQYEYGFTHIDENGKGVIDFNNDNMKALLKKMHQAKENRYLQTRGTYHDYVSSLFTARKSLFTISSTAGLAYNYSKKDPFVIGAANIPHPEGKAGSSINQGPSVCVLDHHDEDRALASFLLWKHITNKANSSAWSLETGYMVVRNSSYDTPEYQAALVYDDNASKYDISKANNLLKLKDAKENTFNTSVFRGSSNARTNVGKLLKDILLQDGQDETIENLFNFYAEDAEKYIK